MIAIRHRRWDHVSIIVPLDGFLAAEAAIPYAAEEADRHRSALVLVRVVPRPEPNRSQAHRGGPARHVVDWRPDAGSEADIAKRYLLDVTRRYGLSPSTILVTPVGDPFARIRVELDRWPHPLVVIAQRESDPCNQQGQLRISDRLTAAAVAPILTINPSFLRTAPPLAYVPEAVGTGGGYY